jgi:hypothetical protein
MHMNDTARLYNCSRCHRQVIICRHCDHGNVYCKHCAPVANEEAKRRAAKRYQLSLQGRLKHAARQKRYRERCKEKVTHNGSIGDRLRDLLRDKRKKGSPTFKPSTKAYSTELVCSFCHQVCSPFLRIDFLAHTSKAFLSIKSGYSAST